MGKKIIEAMISTIEQVECLVRYMFGPSYREMIKRDRVEHATEIEQTKIWVYRCRGRKE